MLLLGYPNALPEKALPGATHDGLAERFSLQLRRAALFSPPRGTAQTGATPQICRPKLCAATND